MYHRMNTGLFINCVCVCTACRTAAVLCVKMLKEQLGSRDSLFVRAFDSWSKGCEFESRQERRKNFFSSQLCVGDSYSVSVPPTCYRSGK